MSRVEQPDYKVTMSDGAIELRAYGPMIAAQAEVKGQRKAAINEGFGLIAGYIFGANTARSKIAMTAPVEQQSAHKASEKIAMTAPVTQQGEAGTWTVRFIMPSQWTMDTLPVPNDPCVVLKPIPARRMLVIRFSGSAGDALIAEKTEELRRFAAEKKLAIVGEPTYAFYNPPWTLPFLRRNEIMFEVTG